RDLDGKERLPRSLDLIAGVPKGTVYHQQAGGGGGFGNPRKRPAKLVADEVRNGVISARAARDLYGVAVNEKTGEIDESQTKLLRKEKGSGSRRAR
ncbi:MAG: hypothetical protein JSV78_15335, partial [Phycisphaerales bacterium]